MSPVFLSISVSVLTPLHLTAFACVLLHCVSVFHRVNDSCLRHLACDVSKRNCRMALLNAACLIAYSPFIRLSNFMAIRLVNRSGEKREQRAYRCAWLDPLITGHGL